MRKKHRTLSDEIFRNSRYIEMVNKQVGCKDFKKEYKIQYDFMYDTFTTLILLNNAFFSDSNISIDEKVGNALNIMEAYLFVDYNESDKRKYSVRTIQNIVERYSARIYRKIDKWYGKMEHLTTKDIHSTNIVNGILDDIEEEMNKLESICFDNWVKERVSYEKNKNSNYKIFICAFDTLNKDNENFLEDYRQFFLDLYGIDLNEEEFDEICFLYTLAAKANNGIVNVLADTKSKDCNLTETSSPQDLYKAYLDTLHLNIKDDYTKLSALHFALTASSIYENICRSHDISFNDMICNFDLYYFLNKMDTVVTANVLSINNDVANKLIKDLQEVYQTITDIQGKDIKKVYTEAFDKIQKIIKRNEKYYIRVS